MLDNHIPDEYREEAEKIEVDEDDREFVSDEIEELKQKKNMLLLKAKNLEEEESPSLDELYLFLCDEDSGEVRFNKMIEDILGWCTDIISPRIYIEKGSVFISFVANYEKCAEDFGCDTLDDLEDMWNDNPFFKSQTGGHVGNYCKFPSRMDPSELLCMLSVDLYLTFVTDETGTMAYDPEEVESDIEDLDNLSDEETYSPFFANEVDLDAPTKKQSWSKRFVPGPIRAAYKKIRNIF